MDGGDIKYNPLETLSQLPTVGEVLRHPMFFTRKKKISTVETAYLVTDEVTVVWGSGICSNLIQAQVLWDD